MTRLARPVARGEPNSPISLVSGTPGKTSASNSREGRSMTVSAAAMMTFWLPVRHDARFNWLRYQGCHAKDRRSWSHLPAPGAPFLKVGALRA